ncbi:YIEGIA family protein [Wukongibacter baidiensis]|uniref:YIEGIA family protein n=1 Tax=Wukongibacter baidiensis TaxID=1723361 RepID=UPI003D7F61F9
MENYIVSIIVSIAVGILSRTYMMRIDHRQYPSYPQGFLSHITLGLIASSLGAVAVPALATKEFGAVTFLSLAAQQFRDVRNLERQSLDNIEPTELVPRGTAYIEDIAKAFEARNYMVMLTSLLTSLAMNLSRVLKAKQELQVITGVIVGIAAMLTLRKLLTRQLIGEIAEIKPAKISFDGPLLTINDVIIMNIGLKGSRKIYEERGIAVEIIPRDPSASATLSNIGQRQAIQHQAATQLGIRKDIDEPDFTPLARRNPHNGNLVMALIPMEPNVDLLVDVVRKTPVLETCRRKPRGKNLKEK